MELKKHITDEKTGISYTLTDGYYLPDLTLPEEEEYEIGRFGRAHLRYLKAHRRPLYLSLLTSCELPRYLHEFDECCNETYEKMMRDYAVKEGVTEQLKAENALEWAGRMNSIRNRVEEVIFHDFVYAGGGTE